MINLLPETNKQEIQAARLNVILLRYNFLVLAALGLLASMCFLFYTVLQANQVNARAATDKNEAQTQTYQAVRTAATEYKSNLTIASQILDNGVSYSSYLISLTKLLPNGVILDGISLNSQTFGQQISLVTKATNYTTATKLKENFQTSTLFGNVHFETLVNDAVAGQSQGISLKYPITATIRVLVKKENQ